MIQRIQTIYLLLVSIISGGLIFVVNLWTSPQGEVDVLSLISKDSLLMKSIPFLFVAASIVGLMAVFLYKNRQLQFVLGRVIILIHLLLLGLLIYFLLTLSGEASVSEKGIGMFVPIIVILLVVLANKAIRKDEDLVKSVDRLR